MFGRSQSKTDDEKVVIIEIPPKVSFIERAKSRLKSGARKVKRVARKVASFLRRKTKNALDRVNRARLTVAGVAVATAVVALLLVYTGYLVVKYAVGHSLAAVLDGIYAVASTTWTGLVRFWYWAIKIDPIASWMWLMTLFAASLVAQLVQIVGTHPVGQVVVIIAFLFTRFALVRSIAALVYIVRHGVNAPARMSENREQHLAKRPSVLRYWAIMLRLKTKLPVAYTEHEPVDTDEPTVEEPPAQAFTVVEQEASAAPRQETTLSTAQNVELLHRAEQYERDFNRALAENRKDESSYLLGRLFVTQWVMEHSTGWGSKNRLWGECHRAFVADAALKDKVSVSELRKGFNHETSELKASFVI